MCVCVKEREREREIPCTGQSLICRWRRKSFIWCGWRKPEGPTAKKLSSPGLPHVEDLFLTIWKSFFRFKAIAKTIFRVVLESQWNWGEGPEISVCSLPRHVSSLPGCQHPRGAGGGSEDRAGAEGAVLWGCRLCSLSGASSEEGSWGWPEPGGWDRSPGSSWLAICCASCERAEAGLQRPQPPCLPQHLSAHRDSESPPLETSWQLEVSKDSKEPQRKNHLTTAHLQAHGFVTDACLCAASVLNCFCDSIFESPYCSKGVPESVTACL